MVFSAIGLLQITAPKDLFNKSGCGVLWKGYALPQHPTSHFFLRRYMPENIYGRNSERLQKIRMNTNNRPTGRQAFLLLFYCFLHKILNLLIPCDVKLTRF